MTRDEMFDYALSQPAAEDSTLHGGRCIRVRGHWIVNESREPDALGLALDLSTIEFLKETEPGTYFQTPHYEGWPAVLVRYEAADDDRLREQIDRAWARRATRAQRKTRGLDG
ncbi:MmcQ/YjbR family DNA-binding protein [Brevundimonas sp.]|uniref:MmcQ/YjbR family DNA-binding protein n=1 Tax=Brevundimonas sp. TaxID=1871086 RepID=UPI002D4A38C6|nr:MmcQ/YjbR family DNA-binding protein [Brevundimonas sp.]HYC97456.1 MmcQ/YjbR family DNA-binding protein [Brevundimonas sp.]